LNERKSALSVERSEKTFERDLRKAKDAATYHAFPQINQIPLGPSRRIDFSLMPKQKSSSKSKEAPPAETGGELKEAPAAASTPQPEVEAVAPASTKDLTANIANFLLRSQKNEDEADAKLPVFLRKQKKRLLALRDAMLDSMNGVAQDNLRSRAEGNEASAFGMHQADAGSDAYDRDFALNLLSQEQDALYEIDEALKRIELGTYGNCEMSGKPINHERLEAIPFTRFTVECQSQIERQNKAQRVRQSVTSLFGLTDEENSDTDEEEFTPDNKE
jgi:DnaK suppressor protein